jgi:predicted  nucleic acid-binding Zn-ribbon protein
MEKKKIEERKTEIKKQHDDLVAKISEGKQAIANMEATLMGLKGAIAQIDWTLNQFKEEKPK